MNQQLNDKLCSAVCLKDIKTALEAIEEGADVDAYNHSTRHKGYPLRYSIVYELEPVFLKLMEKGANIHVDADMPLRNCLSGIRENIPFAKKAIKMLVDKGSFIVMEQISTKNTELYDYYKNCLRIKKLQTIQ